MMIKLALELEFAENTKLTYTCQNLLISLFVLCGYFLLVN